MIVVSDTSPLNYLVLINAVDVLPALFKEIYAPPQVMRELNHPKTPDSVKRWAESAPTWLRLRTPSTVIADSELLDPGEAQAIALATEMSAAGILIDDKKGRRIAREYGLVTLGTITVLELAAKHNLLDLNEKFESLQGTSFQITKTLINATLARDAARKLAEKPPSD